MIKNLYMTLFVSLIFIIVFGCEKPTQENTIAKTDLLGTWINTVNNNDTLRVSENTITRWNSEASCSCHYYDYTIATDTIILNYTGIDKIALKPYHDKISLDKEQLLLTIQDFHLVHPSYVGDVFKKLKIN